MPIKPFSILPQTLNEWTRWLRECIVTADENVTEAQITDGSLLSRNAGNETITGDWTFNAPPKLPAYTVAAAPGVARYARCLIYVTDEVGGPVIAFSDGTNWRRVTDRAIIS